jgi:hypothetical protein
MNRRQIIASLNKIANELDNSRLYAEATSVTSVMKRLAQAVPSELDMDFKGINFWDEKELGRNVVKSMMKIISDCLKGAPLEEEAKEYFKGGNLQSLAMALLDLSLKDGDGNQALMELIKIHHKYNPMGQGFSSPAVNRDEFYRTVRMWKLWTEEAKKRSAGDVQ